MKTFKAIKNFFQSIKNFFRSKYYVLYELITLRRMLKVNNMVRKLIIAKGKDPDYVAPPPQPPQSEISDLWRRHYEAIDKMNSQYRYSRSSSLNNKHVFRRTPTVAKSKVVAAPSPAQDNALNVVIAAAEEATEPFQVVSAASKLEEFTTAVAVNNSEHSFQEALALLIKMVDDLPDTKKEE